MAPEGARVGHCGADCCVLSGSPPTARHHYCRCPSAWPVFISSRLCITRSPNGPKLAPSQELPNSSQCSAVLPLPFQEAIGPDQATLMSQVPPQPSTTGRPTAAVVAQTTCPTPPTDYIQSPGQPSIASWQTISRRPNPPRDHSILYIYVLRFLLF